MRLLHTNISVLTSCLMFLLLLPQTLGRISASTCNRLDLYNKGKCRLGRCLDNEYSIPGNSFCDANALITSNFYSRCFDRQPCCSKGGSCRHHCLPGEKTLSESTDCDSRCCVTYQECGSARALNRRIVGGAIAQPTDWPWVVRILYPQNVGHGICTGVLVDDDTVLTVAHCVVGFSSSDLKVLLCDYDLTQTEPEEERVGVRSIERNPHYQVNKRGNDLAVLKLDRTVTFSSCKLPVCLPDPDVPVVGWDMATSSTRSGPTNQCYIAGWGYTNTEDNKVSSKLHSARVSLMDSSTCNAVLTALGSEVKNVSGLPPDVICTDYSKTKADACKYDDGGMLVCLDEKDRYTLVGLISEYSCGKLPTLYTDISKYIAALKARLEN